MKKIKDINQGDLLAFRIEDDRYRCILCTSTYKEKSPVNFTFALLTYSNIKRPLIEDVFESEFYGVGRTNQDFFNYSDQEIEKMWHLHPEIKPYFLGSYSFVVWRKDFMKFRENFEFIGNFNIVDNLDKNGNSGINASAWSFFKSYFNKDYSKILSSGGQKPFKVKSIIRD